MCKFQLKYQISVGLSRFHFGDSCQYKQAKQCRVPCYRYNCERIHLQPPIKIVMNISAIQQNLCYMLKLDSLTVWQLCWRTKLFGVDKNLASFVLPKTYWPVSKATIFSTVPSFSFFFFSFYYLLETRWISIYACMKIITYVNKMQKKYLKKSLNVRLQSKHSQVLTTSFTFTQQKFPTKLKSPELVNTWGSF